MADHNVKLPSSGGGLIRYSEDSSSKIEMKPIMVIMLILIFILFEMYLHGLKPF